MTTTTIVSDGTPRLIKITHRKVEAGREIKQTNNWPVLFETVMLWDGDVWNKSYRGTDPETGNTVSVPRSWSVRVEEV